MTIDRDRERISDSMQLAGGFAVLGGLVTGAVALVGEVLDQAGVIDEFPGGTCAKVAGGLAVFASVCLTARRFVVVDR